MTRPLPLKCIILAAGASKRLGRHKALLVKEGIPLIRWTVNRLEEQGIKPIIVTRQELMIEIALSCPSRTVIVNPKPDAGRTGTIQCGILHINSEKEKIKPYRLLMVPIDRPGFSDETLSKLVDEERCCVPAKEGRGGHPIMLMPKEIKEILSEENPDRPLHEIVNPVHIEVKDTNLHVNLDREEDVEKWLNSIKSNTEENP